MRTPRQLIYGGFALWGFGVFLRLYQGYKEAGGAEVDELLEVVTEWRSEAATEYWLPKAARAWSWYPRVNWLASFYSYVPPIRWIAEGWAWLCCGILDRLLAACSYLYLKLWWPLPFYWDGVWQMVSPSFWIGLLVCLAMLIYAIVRGFLPYAFLEPYARDLWWRRWLRAKRLYRWLQGDWFERLPRWGRWGARFLTNAACFLLERLKVLSKRGGIRGRTLFKRYGPKLKRAFKKLWNDTFPGPH